MNSLIFRDFFGIFLNFSKFQSIYFELNSLKNIILSHADVAADVSWMKKGVAS